MLMPKDIAILITLFIFGVIVIGSIYKYIRSEVELYKWMKETDDDKTTN